MGNHPPGEAQIGNYRRNTPNLRKVENGASPRGFFRKILRKPNPCGGSPGGPRKGRPNSAESRKTLWRGLSGREKSGKKSVFSVFRRTWRFNLGSETIGPIYKESGSSFLFFFFRFFPKSVRSEKKVTFLDHEKVDFSEESYSLRLVFETEISRRENGNFARGNFDARQPNNIFIRRAPHLSILESARQRIANFDARQPIFF